MMLNLSSVKLRNVHCSSSGFVECDIAYWVWRTVPFILIIIGTFGNLISLIVLTRPVLRRYSTSVYLIVLAVSDILVLYFVVLRETIYAITGTRFADASWLSCKMTWWFAYSAAGCSVFMLVLLTLERVLMVKTPMFLRNKLTPTNAFKTSSAVAIVVLVLNAHMLFGFDFYDSNKANVTFYSYVTEPDLTLYPCYYSSDKYRAFFIGPWSIILLTVYNIVPIIVISVGNMNIRNGLARRRRVVGIASLSDHQTSANPVSANSSGSKPKDKSFTRILLVLSCFFLVTTLPYCVYVVVKNQMTLVTGRTFARLQLLEVCIHCLMYSNFTFDFVFYFVGGTSFRKILKSYATKCKSKLNKCYKLQ